MKTIFSVFSALLVCVALQTSVASAQGVPVVGGPSDLDDIRSQVSAIQTQVDAVRASHDAAVSNQLLAQMLATQNETLARLTEIDLHVQTTEIDQHMIAQALREQAPDAARAQVSGQVSALGPDQPRDEAHAHAH
jgi:hypothetical protein